MRFRRVCISRFRIADGSTGIHGERGIRWSPVGSLSVPSVSETPGATTTFPAVADGHDYTRDLDALSIVESFRASRVLNSIRQESGSAGDRGALCRRIRRLEESRQRQSGTVERDSPEFNKYCFVAVAKIDFPPPLPPLVAPVAPAYAVAEQEVIRSLAEG